MKLLGLIVIIAAFETNSCFLLIAGLIIMAQ